MFFPLLLLAAWTAFGLFFGAQNYARDVYTGKAASLPGYLVGWLLCGYSWGILTVPVMRLARRFSALRLGWTRFFAIHIPLAVFFSLVQIGLYVLIAALLSGRSGGDISEFYKAIVVKELQSSFLVYFVIVSAVMAYDKWTAREFVPPVVPEKANGNGNGFVRRLPVKENGRIALVDTDKIDWVESYGNYVFLHTAERRFIVRETMAAMERKLDPEYFVRIRRSAIVRVDQIVELRLGVNGEYDVSLRCGQVLAATRRYRKNLENIIRS